jgi:hypothetical protein
MWPAWLSRPPVGQSSSTDLLELVGCIANRLLHLGATLLYLAFPLQILVVGDVAGSLFDPALHLFALVIAHRLAPSFVTHT